MYNKVKYGIYAILIILVFFFITDAMNRYESIANKNETDKQGQNGQQNQYDPSYTPPKQYVPPSVEKPADIDDTAPNAAVHDELTPEELQEYRAMQKKSYRLDPSQIAEEEKTTPKTEEEEYGIEYPDPAGVLLLETGKKAEGYKIVSSFNIENDIYTIVSYDDPQTINSYAQVVNRKFYIYKKVNDKFYRSNYLFDISSSLNSKEPADITVVKEKYEIVIKTKPSITRRVNKENLKTNYYQYKNTAALVYLPPAQNSTSNSLNNDTNGSKNSNNMGNINLQ